MSIIDIRVPVKYTSLLIDHDPSWFYAQIREIILYKYGDWQTSRNIFDPRKLIVKRRKINNQSYLIIIIV